MWETTVDGKLLHFKLAGINNQNFIMRDEETGTWWQQVSGEAIFGPLKGKRLKQVFHDELTYATWKHEKPNGRILRPNPEIAAKSKYASENWEARMANVPVTTSARLDSTLAPRTLIVGINVNSVSKAYPFDAVAKQRLILDDIGGVPVFIVLGDDNRSVRAFERTIDGKTLEFFVKESPDFILFDAQTSTEWNFAGTGVKGELTGRQLKKIQVLNDYWFDWKTYNPNTLVYELGNR